MKTTACLLVGVFLLAGCGESEGELITTESGLQYADIIVGTGDFPEETDTVKVHYKGTLEDGKFVDSSHSKGEPQLFSLSGGILKGWKEGLLGMQVGGKRKLIIPPHLGYGEQGMLPRVPSNATLIFVIELIEIVE